MFHFRSNVTLPPSSTSNNVKKIRCTVGSILSSVLVSIVNLYIARQHAWRMTGIVDTINQAYRKEKTGANCKSQMRVLAVYPCVYRKEICSKSTISIQSRQSWIIYMYKLMYKDGPVLVKPRPANIPISIPPRILSTRMDAAKWNSSMIHSSFHPKRPLLSG